MLACLLHSLRLDHSSRPILTQQFGAISLNAVSGRHTSAHDVDVSYRVSPKVQFVLGRLPRCNQLLDTLKPRCCAVLLRRS
jgi:hypothetical protein